MSGPVECAVCGDDQLDAVDQFALLPRVTSDCKPFAAGGSLAVCSRCGTIQKPPDGAWISDIERIYRAYEIYQLSDGAEQPIFTPGGPVPRSRVLVDFLVRKTTLASEGRLIDIGCGNGAALANFSAALPQWRLDGNELSDSALGRLRRLPNFDTLYTCDPGKIPGRYDLVTMIHSLEHMLSPRSVFAVIARLLATGGRLFVEVPDVETSPFDLLVADHRTHFTCATLAHLAAGTGYAVDFIDNGVLPKEISLIAHRDAAPEPLQDAASGLAIARAATRWLSDVLAAAAEAARHEPFGLFGSSISAMWLFGALRERVSFFVDEDPARIGRHCEGRPIRAPGDVPPGAAIYVPMLPAIANRIAARYAGASARFVTPPGFQ